MADDSSIIALDAEDNILGYTHSVRKGIVVALMPNGQLPSDPANTKIVLAALDGMDRSALTRKRIKTDEKKIDSDAAAAELISKVLIAAGSSGNKRNLPITQRALPVLGTDVPEPLLVEGETSTNAPVQNYDSFVSKIAASENS